MKIIATYRIRAQADEDRTFLMHKGIASVVHGNVGPKAMSEHFKPEPISLAVQDSHAVQAKDILRAKYHPAPIPNFQPY